MALQPALSQPSVTEFESTSLERFVSAAPAESNSALPPVKRQRMWAFAGGVDSDLILARTFSAA